MPPELILDPAQIDTSQFVADREQLRQVNPHRFEMEQLDAIVSVDKEQHIIIGYRDVRADEFWVRGHMPGFPLMPGVVMCEAAAQLAGFYASKYKLLGGDFVGFGGMDEIRFRAPVFPPCRLILLARMLELRPHRRAKFEFQGIVKDQIVFTGSMLGVPITRNQRMDL